MSDSDETPITPETSEALDSAAEPNDDSQEPGHEHVNRLINESSPYLLKHAHNPVDWYTWGPEAETRRRLKINQSC